MHHDRRRHLRIPGKMEVEVEAEDGTQIRGVVQDMSLHGLFLATEARLVVGSRCQVLLYLGGSDAGLPVRTEGVIARTSETGVAIQFEQIVFDAFAFLRRLLPSGEARDAHRAHS